MVDELADEFDAPRETIARDVKAMLQDLADKGFLGAWRRAMADARLPGRREPVEPSRRWACWPS